MHRNAGLPAFPYVVGPLTSIAMLLANGEVQHPDGYWQGVLVNGLERCEWKCSHKHTSRRAARQCARDKWFEHHG